MLQVVGGETERQDLRAIGGDHADDATRLQGAGNLPMTYDL